MGVHPFMWPRHSPPPKQNPDHVPDVTHNDVLYIHPLL